MKYTLCVSSFYIAIYAFLTGSPYVYIDVYGVPKEYFGYLFSVNIIGVMLLSAINRRIVSAIRSIGCCDMPHYLLPFVYVL